MLLFEALLRPMVAQERRGQGLAEAILSTFDHHGIKLDAANRQVILTCRDTALLRRWLDLALMAKDASEVVAELEKYDLTSNRTFAWPR